MKTNFHTHSTWCDGRDSLAEIANVAFDKGFAALGFSSHAMFPSDPFDWPLTKEKSKPYVAEIDALKKAYDGRMQIFCGVEADFVKGACLCDRAVYSSIRPDYVIGSVHYVVAPDGEWVAVDLSPESLLEGIGKHFAGDVREYIRAYFAQQREMAAMCDFDVIGHPDLCRKFNGLISYFDENAAWYLEELEATAQAFSDSGKIVEVNTGAIARGWMNDAYPSLSFRRMLRECGVRFILSSDAHSAEALDCAFDRFSTEEDFLSTPFESC